MQIAVYGKGGIGKSTVSANLSAALAALGTKVLQIGCDPKHDSTRLLHHGQRITTVLDYLLNTSPDDQKPDDVLAEGYMGAGCIEAGGPRPGKGCAGRGILTAFEFLNKHSVLDPYDVVVYDVLGDVVCGGFAVPVRKEYAQGIFLVTSGEAMSIYAANNILHGINNLDPDGSRIAGIIYNSRGAGDEKERVYEFARAVDLPICLSLPRSEAFLKAEREAKTLTEMDPGSREAELFTGLAEHIREGLQLYPAKPLSEEQMELFMRGEGLGSDAGLQSRTGRQNEISAFGDCEACEKAGTDKETVTGEQRTDTASENVQPSGTASVPKKRALSDPFSRVPLSGCSYRGAVDLAVHIKDAAVLGHAPKSCTSYAVNGLSSYGRNGLFSRGIIYPSFIPQHFDNTDIDIRDAVYGGAEHFREKALELAKKGNKYIVAVTSCIPGLSGDDLEPVKDELKAMGVDMYIIHADGVEVGDYNDGMAFCYKAIANEAIKPVENVDKESINIVYELNWSLNTQDNYEKIEALLKAMGIRVNCRYLYDTTMEEINGFLRAPYCIMAREDKLGREIKELFENKYGCSFIADSFPRGFGETRDLVTKLGILYSKEKEAAVLIEKGTNEYNAALRSLRQSFEGIDVMAFLGNSSPWVKELLQDLELDLKYVLTPENEADNQGWTYRFSEAYGKDREEFSAKAERIRPKLILTTDPSILSKTPEGSKVIMLPRSIGTGFTSGTDEAYRWIKNMGTELKGRWKNDRSVFEKYYC